MCELKVRRHLLTRKDSDAFVTHEVSLVELLGA